MASVAEQLRNARETQNLTIEHIAGITNVRGDHIRAIEEGNYDVFSAPVYIKGFVRTYAKLLKLDVPQIMGALEGELGRTEKFSEPPPLTEQPHTAVDFVTLQLSKIDWRKAVIALGVVVMLVVGYAIYSAFKGGRRSAPDLKPGLYRPATNRSGNTLPLPPPARRP